MSSKHFALIAAQCENRGIGISGRLPWRLKNEMAYFTDVTSKTEDDKKRNAVVMGRKTWDSIPK
ncbi:dihydrofolate reductase-like protein, partial [Leptotrombidium deliense]